MFISDNGRAFNTSEAEGRGEGIESMARRAEGISGKISFSSEPGRGTTIILDVPLSEIDQNCARANEQCINRRKILIYF
jgi:nitrate/nitrite-specific signal transduction histidine kinase